MSTDNEGCDNSEDVFRILVTNDNHVGYKEDDSVRQKDALVTFEEIMHIARVRNVDFVLHSGDLFDDCRPNRFWTTSVMRILQENCFGDKGVKFRHLRTAFSKPANFEDPNRNIDLPMYLIHGNHDDPGGEYGDARPLSAADTLETNYLVNYFGRQDNVEEEIEVRPILLEKGSSRLALYGLGNMHDERLHRMFQSKKVKFLAPPVDQGFFNLMSIHQNRYRGASGGIPAKNCVHTSFLPSFLNLVVWAHEHECIPVPQESVECGFHILQSGSSVQTSLAIGEQAAKHVFLIEICGDKFRSTPIPLLTVRSFVFDEVMLPPSSSAQQTETVLANRVEAMLARGREESGVRIQARSAWLEKWGIKPMYAQTLPELPLVRLRVVAGDLKNEFGQKNAHIFNHKFGRQFAGRIANSIDILHFVTSKRAASRTGDKTGTGVLQLEIEDAPQSSLTGTAASSAESLGDVQDLIFNYLGGQQGEALLDSLPEPDFNVAVQDFVHKNDSGAIERFLKFQLEAINAFTLQSSAADAESISVLLRERSAQIRNDRLHAALAVVEGQDKSVPPADEARVSAAGLVGGDVGDGEDDFFNDPTGEAFGGIEVGPMVEEVDEEEELDDDEVFNATAVRGGQKSGTKRAAAKQTGKRGKVQKTILSQQSAAAPLVNPIMAAFLSQSSQQTMTTTATATATQNNSAKRQWTRRM